MDKNYYYYFLKINKLGNIISHFLKLDMITSNFSHTFHAWALVNVDFSKDLLGKTNIKTNGAPWIELVNYEGFLFYCRRFFSIRHLASNYPHFCQFFSSSSSGKMLFVIIPFFITFLNDSYGKALG